MFLLHSQVLNMCSIPLNSIFICEHLVGVPAQSALHPWQPGSSQRAGWWRSDSEAVGIRLRLPQDYKRRPRRGNRRQGDEEVAGTGSVKQKRLPSE